VKILIVTRYKTNGEERMERINDGRLLLDVTARCTQKKYTAGNQLKEVSLQSVKDAILIRNKKFS
jgi:hypothetical protein